MTKQINGDKLFVINPHPAIPPADQLKKWEDKWFDEEEHADVLLIQAFQAGADQELEACYGWVEGSISTPEAAELRAARRPKPPSLKEQALAALEGDPKEGAMIMIDVEQFNTIRRALEALPND
jgi:hypothetical protein